MNITAELWLAIFSSSVVSGVVVALIAGAYALRGKQNEYVNDYYKTVIQRRIAAYEKLEALIVSVKSTVIEGDSKPYHLLFAKEGDWESAYQLLHNVMSQGLWLSDEVFEKVRDLNYLVFRINPDNTSVIDFGKQNYETIATLRADLEKILVADMLMLHDVEAFFKCKKKNTQGFHSVQIRN